MQEELIAVLTDEHRQLREVLLDLIDAFENSDSERVSEGIEEMAALAGPHFYYEQEALYPALAEVLGDEQFETLLEEHDIALEAARQLAELAEQEALDEEAAEYGAELARQLLPHVSEGDGVAVMVEALEPQTLKKLHKAKKQAKKSGVTLAHLAKRATKKAGRKRMQRKVATKRAAAASRPTKSKAHARKTPAGVKRRRK